MFIDKTTLIKYMLFTIRNILLFYYIVTLIYPCVIVINIGVYMLMRYIPTRGGNFSIFNTL